MSGLSVFVSCGGCNEYHKLGSLNNRIYSHSSKARSPKPGCAGTALPLEALQKDPSLPFSASRGWRPPSACACNSLLSLHTAFSSVRPSIFSSSICAISLCLFLIRTFVMACKSHLDKPRYAPPLKIANHIFCYVR